MMGWLDLLGDEEMAGGLNDGDKKEDSFEADKWEEVKA